MCKIVTNAVCTTQCHQDLVAVKTNFTVNPGLLFILETLIKLPWGNFLHSFNKKWDNRSPYTVQADVKSSACVKQHTSGVNPYPWLCLFSLRPLLEWLFSYLTEFSKLKYGKDNLYFSDFTTFYGQGSSEVHAFNFGLPSVTSEVPSLSIFTIFS